MGQKFYTAKLDDAWTKLHMTQDRSKELRNKFIEDQIKAAEATTDKERTEKLQAIKKAEYQKKLWPKLRRYAKGEVKTGLNRVDVPIRDNTGEIIDWHPITAPVELFTALLNRNIAHFAQAKDTPFVEGTFGNHLHPFQQNDFSESILNGTTVDLTPFDINTASHQSLCQQNAIPSR